MLKTLNKARWAVARITFIAYISFSVVTLVGGFLTAPVMTWYFFGDWRFWRHWSAGLGLWPHALRLIRLMLSDNRGFMFSVQLTSPPSSSPDPEKTALNAQWPHGKSCGDCSNCCRPGGHVCPLLDTTAGLCRGYDSFFWRYFNCGRFPSVRQEIDYYDCRKWVLTEAPGVQAGPARAAGFAARAIAEQPIAFRPRPRGGAAGTAGAATPAPPAQRGDAPEVARKA